MWSHPRTGSEFSKLAKKVRFLLGLPSLLAYSNWQRGNVENVDVVSSSLTVSTISLPVDGSLVS